MSDRYYSSEPYFWFGKRVGAYEDYRDVLAKDEPRGPMEMGVSFSTGRHGDRQLTEQEIDAAWEALRVWQDVSGVRFSPDGDDPFRIGARRLDGPGEYAPSFTKPRTVWIDADRFMDPSKPFVAQDPYRVLVHEIGHAIGLNHFGDYNGAGVTYEDDATFYYDTIAYSVMSYFSEAYTRQDFKGNEPMTPMPMDIDVIQHLFGANLTTRNGHNTYGYNVSGRDMRAAHDFTNFDVSANEGPVLTIYDMGGIDTIDLSGSSTDNRLDLTPGARSDVLGLTGNLVIYRKTLIENAVGGSGDDEITGNSRANIIEDSSGSDTYDGAGGYDTLSFRNMMTGVDLHVDRGFARRKDSSGDVDRFKDFERYYGSQDGDDIFMGTVAAPVYAENGHDHIWSAAAGGTLYGGAGIDTFYLYGAASGTVHGGRGGDVANFALARSAATVNLAYEVAYVGGARFSLIQIESAVGSRFDDLLIGDARATGSNMNGGAGADTFITGGGTNWIYGGADVDTVVYASGDVKDISRSGPAWVVETDDSVDFLYDVELIKMGASAPTSLAAGHLAVAVNRFQWSPYAVEPEIDTFGLF